MNPPSSNKESATLPHDATRIRFTSSAVLPLAPRHARTWEGRHRLGHILLLAWVRDTSPPERDDERGERKKVGRRGGARHFGLALPHFLARPASPPAATALEVVRKEAGSGLGSKARSHEPRASEKRAERCLQGKAPASLSSCALDPGPMLTGLSRAYDPDVQSRTTPSRGRAGQVWRRSVS